MKGVNKMKRILSIAISMLLISNIFGVALLADAAEETCYQDAAVGLNPPVTNDFDIGLDAENGSLWGATEVALLSQRFEKRRYETDEQINNLRIGVLNSDLEKVSGYINNNTK